MITDNTPDRIRELGQTIADAAFELEKVFLELDREADAQLAAAAGNFIVEHARRTPAFASYVDAKTALVNAAIAASNIKDLTSRSLTLRSKCDWWRNVLTGSRQQTSDVQSVCAQIPKVWIVDLPSVPNNDVAPSANDGGLAANDVAPAANDIETPAKHVRHPGSVWIDAHYSELPGGEWVAASKDGLVAHDPSPETLNTKVAGAGLTPDQVTIAYIERELGPALERQ